MNTTREIRHFTSPERWKITSYYIFVANSDWKILKLNKAKESMYMRFSHLLSHRHLYRLQSTCWKCISCFGVLLIDITISQRAEPKKLLTTFIFSFFLHVLYIYSNIRLLIINKSNSKLALTLCFPQLEFVKLLSTELILFYLRSLIYT